MKQVVDQLGKQLHEQITSVVQALWPKLVAVELLKLDENSAKRKSVTRTPEEKAELIARIQRMHQVEKRTIREIANELGYSRAYISKLKEGSR